MPIVTRLDGKTYEVDEETLERCRIPDEDVASFNLPELPTAPAPVPEPVIPRIVPHPFVNVSQAPTPNGFVINIQLPPKPGQLQEGQLIPPPAFNPGEENEKQQTEQKEEGGNSVS